jgi:4-deoxy-L-threo-5-hexosulose-uronate ketol-isomerase
LFGIFALKIKKMHIQVRHAANPTDFKHYDTARIRADFLVEKLFVPDQFHFVYSHHDRMIVGGVKPVGLMHKLPIYDELRADYFLERREIGILNIGGDGFVMVGDELFTLQKRDCLYVGMDNKEVTFKSLDSENPAKFILVSTPAHRHCPTTLMRAAEAMPVELGTIETSNVRTIYKYIHADGIESCQLVMGMTALQNGSVWNTMPPHTHDRRSEMYVYFDLEADHRVFHYMGTPDETRHVVVANEQAIISPPWSVHAGSGTTSYSFLWAMAGENYTFTDMDVAKISELK